MSRAALTLIHDIDRKKASNWAWSAPAGTRCEFKAPKRTIEQNSRLWAMLTDVATQLRWHGMKMSTSDWKIVFMDALKREMRLVPNIDGTGFVALGRSSSDLTKGEMSDLIEIISAFGAKHGVVFNDPPSL